MVDVDLLLDRFADRDVEDEHPWAPPSSAGPFEPGFFFLGSGNPPLEVLVVPVTHRPKRDEVRDLWRIRQGKRAAPLLLICPFQVDGAVDAHIIGPVEADLAVRELGLEQTVGLAAGALGEPSGLAAVRFLQQQIPRDDQEFAGLVNQGMFAAHTSARARARAARLDAGKRTRQAAPPPRGPRPRT
jgi:hypothetical protein